MNVLLFAHTPRTHEVNIYTWAASACCPDSAVIFRFFLPLLLRAALRVDVLRRLRVVRLVVVVLLRAGAAPHVTSTTNLHTPPLIATRPFNHKLAYLGAYTTAH